MIHLYIAFKFCCPSDIIYFLFAWLTPSETTLLNKVNVTNSKQLEISERKQL